MQYLAIDVRLGRQQYALRMCSESSPLQRTEMCLVPTTLQQSEIGGGTGFCVHVKLRTVFGRTS